MTWADPLLDHEPRKPAATVLHRALCEHLETFFDRAALRGAQPLSVPSASFLARDPMPILEVNGHWTGPPSTPAPVSRTAR